MEKCTLTVCNSTVYNSKTKQNKNTMLNDRNLGDYIVEYPKYRNITDELKMK